MSHAKPSRRRIYLVRHAEVAYFDDNGKPLNPRDVSLTENGRTQANALAAALSHVPLDLAVSSGMPRTEQTAQPLLRERALALRADPRLREIRSGRLREIPADSRETAIAHAYDAVDRPGATFMGGEAWEAFAERVLHAFADLLAENAWSNALIVAHDAVNRVLLSQILGNGIAHLNAIEQDHACINIIELDIEAASIRRAFVRTLNLTPYDPIRAEHRLTVMERVFLDYRP